MKTMKKAVLMVALLVAAEWISAQQSTGQKIENGTKKAWNKTKEGTHKAWDSTKAVSGRTWDKTKDGTQKAWDSTKAAFHKNEQHK